MDCDTLYPSRASAHSRSRRNIHAAVAVVLVLGLVSPGTINKGDAYGTVSNAATWPASPKAVCAVTVTPDRYLIAGGANEVSCASTVAGPVWTNKLRSTLAGLAARVEPDGFRVIATDVRGAVYVWDKDGRPSAGWPRHLESVVTAAPVWVDWAGGAVVVPTHAGLVHALDPGGEPMPGWPIDVGARVLSAAAAAAVNGTTAILVAAEDGRLHAFRETGRPVAGFPVSVDTRFIASPAVVDLTHDGGMEICIGGADGRVWLFDSSGEALDGWPVRLSSPVGTSPAFGDVDADGDTDVVVATRSGGVWVLGLRGDVLDGWPLKTRGLVLSSPVVVNLDGVAGDEVMVTTYGGWAHCWNGSGKPLAEWPRFMAVTARTQPAVLDPVDGDPGLVALPGVARPDYVTISSSPESARKDPRQESPEATDVPAAFSLRMSSNPIRPSRGDNAAVHLSLPDHVAKGGVATTIVAYDVSGRRVSEVYAGVLGPGAHVLPWGASASLSSGIYFIRVRAGVESVTTKVLIFR